MLAEAVLGKGSYMASCSVAQASNSFISTQLARQSALISHVQKCFNSRKVVTMQKSSYEATGTSCTNVANNIAFMTKTYNYTIHDFY